MIKKILLFLLPILGLLFWLNISIFEKKENFIDDTNTLPFSGFVDTKENNYSISENNEIGESETYSVVRVVDGDTVVLSIDGVDTTLRLIGLDTPEVVDPRKPVQCFGVEASNRAKELLSGQSVTLSYDNTQDKIDKYGRLLAYLYLPDGRLFNKIMIEEGYAHEYTYFIPYEKQKEFKQAEDFARIEKMGLWQDGVCEDFEKTIYENNEIKKNEIISSGANAFGSDYVCTENTYNCTDFETRDESQYVYMFCGGITNDIHFLDKDKDGESCETLP